MIVVDPGLFSFHLPFCVQLMPPAIGKPPLVVLMFKRLYRTRRLAGFLFVKKEETPYLATGLVESWRGPFWYLLLIFC